jgi:hypothetical protein
MQPFMKVKKKMGMTESTRQVLNRAIDILHRVSSKKLSEELARKELSTTLSTHFLNDGDVDPIKKIKLQRCLEEVNEVTSSLDKGKIPLYEAIMLVNRIVVSGATHQPPPLPETKATSFQIRPKITPYEEDVEYINQEFDISGNQREKNLQLINTQKLEDKVQEIVREPVRETAPLQTEEDVTLLLNRVLLNKKQLEEAISDLNGTLQSIGFELRAIK